jgi:hypothetical protein
MVIQEVPFARTSSPEMPWLAFADSASSHVTSGLPVRAHLKAQNVRASVCARRRRCAPASFPPSLRLRFTVSAHRPQTEVSTGFFDFGF